MKVRAKSHSVNPKSLGVKIGSPAEVLWSKVKDESEILIQQSRDNLVIQLEVLKLAERMIAEEKAGMRKV